MRFSVLLYKFNIAVQLVALLLLFFAATWIISPELGYAKSCKTELKKLCSGKRGGDLYQCFKGKKSQFDPACRAKIDRALNKKFSSGGKSSHGSPVAAKKSNPTKPYTSSPPNSLHEPRKNAGNPPPGGVGQGPPPELQDVIKHLPGEVAAFAGIFVMFLVLNGLAAALAMPLMFKKAGVSLLYGFIPILSLHYQCMLLKLPKWVFPSILICGFLSAIPLIGLLFMFVNVIAYLYVAIKFRMLFGVGPIFAFFAFIISPLSFFIAVSKRFPYQGGTLNISVGVQPNTTPENQAA